MEITRQEFHCLMLEIDDKIAANHPEIPGRELAALSEFGKLFPGNIHFIDESNPVIKWYEAMYGDRLKGFGPWLSSIVLIKKTPYRVSFPIIIGQTPLDLFGFIEGLTEFRKNTLSEDERTAIGMLIAKLFMSLSRIENIDVFLWYGDLIVAITMIMNRHCNFGISKWASLQMTEKMIKYFLKKTHGKYPRSHDINDLFHRSAEHGLELPPQEWIDSVTCSAGARYGEEKVTIDEAVAAHHSAIFLCDHIAKGLGVSKNIELASF